jgi:SAM-dependent methyltransferase
VEEESLFERLWPLPDYRTRWQWLLGLLEAQPGERILDVGCGNGTSVHYVARRVGLTGAAIGLERHQHRLTGLRASESAASYPIGVAGLAEALPFKDATFDAVLCVNVLEAVPDRLTALRGIRRVLRPGGRSLVAHDDWESQIYAGADRDLTRRAVRAYADATLASYASSDGQMGRHLFGLMREAGFQDVEVRALPVLNTEYREGLFGWVHAQFDAELVAKVSDLTQRDLDEWRAQLQAASDRGDYLYCGTLYACTAS